jgi:chromosome segregation ATPase
MSNTDSRVARLERAIPPLKSTLRALSEQEEGSRALVSILASSVEKLAMGTAQGQTDMVRALRDREETLTALVRTLSSSLETLADATVRAHTEAAQQTRAEMELLRSKLAEVGDLVAKHDAVPERLASMVGKAFKDCIEVGLSTLEARIAQMINASDERMVLAWGERLAAIENRLDALGAAGPMGPAHMVKLEDWMHMTDTQDDGAGW